MQPARRWGLHAPDNAAAAPADAGPGPRPPEQRNTVKADSIEELAALIGAPADVLKETIDRYNELVTKGTDDDFHKPADFLYPVVKAPFYAAKVGVALLAVVGGLSVNTDLQVLDDEKKPIEGLYATGNTSGDLYAIDYPINMAGNSNGRCVIWGYLLGKTMAKATASGATMTSDGFREAVAQALAKAQ